MSDQGLWVGPDRAPDTYRLVESLGTGGEGSVWRGIVHLSETGQSNVAVKVQPSVGDEGDWDRYGLLLQSLHHPGLVSVREVFTGASMHLQGQAAANPRRSRYVVMSHVDGMTLTEWVDENPDATASARLAMLRSTASALDAMHNMQLTTVPVAHGDVKPANIVITRATGAPVLVDLGLARLVDATGVSGRTNAYAAPELRGSHAQATPAADKYAFVASLAHVLLGTRPPVDTYGFLDVEALRVALNQAPVTARRPQLVQQILHALSVPPDQRPPSLAGWLASCSDSLSQVTGPTPHVPAVAAMVDPSQTQPLETPATHVDPAFGAAAMTTLRGPSGSSGTDGWPTSTDRLEPSRQPGRSRGALVGAIGGGVLLLAAVAGLLITHPWSTDGAASASRSTGTPSPTVAATTGSSTTAPATSAPPSPADSPSTDATTDAPTPSASDNPAPSDSATSAISESILPGVTYQVPLKTVINGGDSRDLVGNTLFNWTYALGNGNQSGTFDHTCTQMTLTAALLNKVEATSALVEVIQDRGVVGRVATKGHTRNSATFKLDPGPFVFRAAVVGNGYVSFNGMLTCGTSTGRA